ncbi:hypothetical protein PMI13_03049 [Chryseobacterium populi]|uniref:Uncharacterized protein n=1 Tax=Chryseobacterium populi TaxID=1144316 RepID=J3CEJ4_9FLAO|nr:hypothetical protein PMI13_03049 [Chryseobacterium populi]
MNAKNIILSVSGFIIGLIFSAVIILMIAYLVGFLTIK